MSRRHRFAPSIRRLLPKSARRPMTHAELIDDLVAANRILTDRGVFDAYGHISARDPRNHGALLARRAACRPRGVTADDIIEFDLDNNPVRAGENRLFFERVIHGEIYKARPDVMAVCHNHSPSLIPFCQQRDAAAADGRQRRFPGRGRAGVRHPHRRRRGRSQRLHGAAGERAGAGARIARVVLLRGHGAVAVGESVRQCVRHAIIAETNARAQIEATMLGPVQFLTASELAYAQRSKPKDADRAWRALETASEAIGHVGAIERCSRRPGIAAGRSFADAPLKSRCIAVDVFRRARSRPATRRLRR